ncbi:MAG: ArnT family glycosyltransferase [Terriglobales bacterium]
MIPLSQRVGRPQFYALLFLFAFLGQCLWTSYRRSLTPDELALIAAGREQWRDARVAATTAHSPLVPLVGNAALLLPAHPPDDFQSLRLFLRLPFVIAGFLFGASLWHVARRLYGNTGGYIALALYCFSPLMVVAGATVGHDLIAAWGMFGAVFTAVALAHTLLAPPEDRIRRTVLLGVALGMGISADYSVSMVIPVALPLMLYLAPERRAATLAWLAAASGITALILWAVFFFDAQAMLTALRQARFFALRPSEVTGGIPYPSLVTWLIAALPSLLLFGLAIVGFARLHRSRYFGNALPLALGGALFVMSLATPYYLSVQYVIWALPFLYLFGAGVFADLLEEPNSQTRARRVLVALLVLNAATCVGWLEIVNRQ